MDDNNDEEEDIMDIDDGRLRLDLNDNQLFSDGIGDRTTIINKFGLKVFQSLMTSEKNPVICPLNLFSSLLILYIGSNGETFFELREFLDFKNFDDDTVFGTVRDALQVATSEKTKMKPNYDLLNQIRVLIDKKADPSDKFHIWTKRYFNADLHFIDFKRDGHMITEQINESIGIDLKTKQFKTFDTKIDERTQLLVMSAINFKKEWDCAFPSGEIVESDFFNDGITKVKVRMMAIYDWSRRITYSRNWDSNIIEMSGGTIQFLLVLPKNINGMPHLLKEFNYETLERVLNGFHSEQCDIYLPQFKLDFGFDSAKYFSQLIVFSENSQMEDISVKYKFKANHVLHKVVFETKSNGHFQSDSWKTQKTRSRIIKADHPFLFIVRDVRTQTYLFIGKVTTI